MGKSNILNVQHQAGGVPLGHSFRARVPGAKIFMLPRALQQDEREDDHGPADPHDEADFEHGGIGGGTHALADSDLWIHWANSSRSCKIYHLCPALIFFPLCLNCHRMSMWKV